MPHDEYLQFHCSRVNQHSRRRNSTSCHRSMSDHRRNGSQSCAPLDFKGLKYLSVSKRCLYNSDDVYFHRHSKHRRHKRHHHFPDHNSHDGRDQRTNVCHCSSKKSPLNHKYHDEMSYMNFCARNEGWEERLVDAHQRENRKRHCTKKEGWTKKPVREQSDKIRDNVDVENSGMLKRNAGGQKIEQSESMELVKPIITLIEQTKEFLQTETSYQHLDEKSVKQLEILVGNEEAKSLIPQIVCDDNVAKSSNGSLIREMSKRMSHDTPETKDGDFKQSNDQGTIDTPGIDGLYATGLSIHSSDVASNAKDGGSKESNHESVHDASDVEGGGAKGLSNDTSNDKSGTKDGGTKESSYQSSNDTSGNKSNLKKPQLASETKGRIHPVDPNEKTGKGKRITSLSTNHFGYMPKKPNTLNVGFMTKTTSYGPNNYSEKHNLGMLPFNGKGLMFPNNQQRKISVGFRTEPKTMLDSNTFCPVRRPDAVNCPIMHQGYYPINENQAPHCNLQANKKYSYTEPSMGNRGQ